jgi:hypothetical protein
MSDQHGDHEQHEDVYLDQARWLLAWHERRSEAFMTRAVGLLGLVGVLDALLLQQVSRTNGPDGATGWVLLTVTLVALLVAAAFSLLTLTSQEIVAPSVGQLREWWVKYLSGDGQESPKADVAENVLHGTTPDSTSPLDAAKHAASARATHFKRAVFAMAAALLLLALFVAQVAAAA